MSNFWRDCPVLVTGGAGFIGSHLVGELLTLGAKVRVLARYNSSGSWGYLNDVDPAFASNLDVRLGTVDDVAFTRACTEGIDTVFHLAALIGIPYSYAAPSHYVDVNVNGTLAVLEACRATGVRRMVHTSTSETFGSAQYLPMNENHPLVAQSPYAATKIAADKLVESYVRSFDLPAVTLRPFNTFGPRQSMRAVIPTIIQQLLAGPQVRIGSTTPIRDMNPVANTVAGFLRAAEVDAIEGELFVVGSGVGVSVGQLIDTVAGRLGVTPEVIVEDQRTRPEASEVDQLVCDYSKASAGLGYIPQVTLEEGLERTIKYCRDHPMSRLEYSI